MNFPRILFAGTPEFAVPSLDALFKLGYKICAVYTQPDRPSGRGRKFQPSPVKQYAQAHDIPILQPISLRQDLNAVAQLRAFQADLLIVVAYGLLLPAEILKATRLGCVNVHASLLPRWRGAAPIQRAILAGDVTSGVCVMRMEETLDTGPIYAQREILLDPRETSGSLHDRLAILGAELLTSVLPEILAESGTPVAQDHGRAIYAHKLMKQEARINWTQTSEFIERQVRAFNPWPVAETVLNGIVLRIWEAEVIEYIKDNILISHGSIITADQKGIVVATGNGTIRITRLQPPGKRIMTAGEYLCARSLAGTHFD